MVSPTQNILEMNQALGSMTTARSARIRSANPDRSRQDWPYWDCRLTKSEKVLLPLVSLMAGALHLAPVLHSGLGIPLLYTLAGISYLSPMTGFFFIACGQFLPFPAGSVHNPAQVGVLVWLPVILLRYHRLNLRGVSCLWPVLPWLLWFMILTGQMVFLPESDYMKALAYSVIACQLANEARGRFLKCLFGLCLGAILVMTAYWASQLGLPVEATDWGGEREGFARMGSIRADAVMVWPALLIGISGLIGLQIALASRRSPMPSPLWLTYGTLILSVASLPPLISTMCHGAFFGFALTTACVIWAARVAMKKGAYASSRFRALTKWGLVGIGAMIILFALDLFQVRTKSFKLGEYYTGVTTETSLAASRTGVWRDSIHTILKYPILGICITGDQEEITSEYASSGFYLSHNVFLDYARGTGIPGMLLLAFFFFCPAIRMWQSGDVVRYIPFLLAHFAMLIFWMSLSFQFYKTFWALWMLMVMAEQSAKNAMPYWGKRRPSALVSLSGGFVGQGQTGAEQPQARKASF
jgi:O-antigen ligase